jgi:expansin (peptidoglycan-binding protein)
MKLIGLLSLVAAELTLTIANASQAGQFDMFKTMQRGDGTYYGKNGDSAGACEDHRVAGNKVLWGHNAITVAINKPQWYNGKACGTCLEVTSPRMGLNKAFAIVNNLCPECHTGDLDFATNGDGRWNDLRWKAVPCKGSFFSKFAFIMQGSNQWYLKVAVKRSKYPVTSLEVKANGRWVRPSSTEGSYFVFNGQQLSFPLPVRVKSVAAPGEEVQDVIQRLANEQLIEGSAQFESGGGGADDEDEEEEEEEEEDNGELWPMLYTYKKCEIADGDAPSRVLSVSGRAECQAMAKAESHPFYNYDPDQKRCFASATCNSPKKTTYNWNIYAEEEEEEEEDVTPPPTPEAAGICQPWCEKHEITKWGARGTDTPGAKCSWKRCGGCAQCTVSAAPFPMVSSSLPRKLTRREKRLARKAKNLPPP